MHGIIFTYENNNSLILDKTASVIDNVLQMIQIIMLF